jgi:hypothetical protein
MALFPASPAGVVIGCRQVQQRGAAGAVSWLLLTTPAVDAACVQRAQEERTRRRASWEGMVTLLAAAPLFVAGSCVPKIRR